MGKYFDMKPRNSRLNKAERDLVNKLGDRDLSSIEVSDTKTGAEQKWASLPQSERDRRTLDITAGHYKKENPKLTNDQAVDMAKKVAEYRDRKFSR